MSAGLRGLALALVVCSCANAGNGGGGGGDDAPKIDASVKHDANLAGTDAPPPADAMVDAMADAMVDAPSGPFCSTNAQCTTSGECCVTLGGGMGFCAPGTILAGTCIPQ